MIKIYNAIVMIIKDVIYTIGWVGNSAEIVYNMQYIMHIRKVIVEDMHCVIMLHQSQRLQQYVYLLVYNASLELIFNVKLLI